LGACSVGETLPFHCADLPADLFTCCLITPIQTSLLCHMLKLGVKSRFPQNIIDDIPGVLTDRRTLLGELNWIFTAITDTIAWSCLSMDTFQKLFRQVLYLILF
jgi:regulatory associated protein of mTOR